MAWIIGTDEAGYGPNFGPLVIAASVWQVPDVLLSADFRVEFAELFDESTTGWKAEPKRLPIADSKTLYRPPEHLGWLELPLFSLSLKSAGNLLDVWEKIASSSLADVKRDPCCGSFNPRLPTFVSEPDLACALNIWKRLAETYQTSVHKIQAEVVWPARFNAELQTTGNKAAVLSRTTFKLVADLLAELPAEGSVLILSDKHGGRNRYLPFLQAAFEECWIQSVHESQAISRYRWDRVDESQQRLKVEARLAVKSEQFLPVALASMAAKYLRELAMQGFNAFWQRHLPNLKPTAGYPQDAKRFREEIADVQTRLGIADHQLWRLK